MRLSPRHLDRVREIAKRYGYEPMMWEDMFFRLAVGGYYRNETVEFPAEVLQKVPQDVTMVYWDYYGDSAEYYDNMIRSSKNLSDNVWFAGGAWIWGGYAPHSRLSIRRNALAIPACIRAGIRNAFFTMWGDNGGECPYFSALPALMHAAATAEGMTEEQYAGDIPRRQPARTTTPLWSSTFQTIFSGRGRWSAPRTTAKTVSITIPSLGFCRPQRRGCGAAAFIRSMRQDCTGARRKAEASDICSRPWRISAMRWRSNFPFPKRRRALYASGDKEGLRTLAENEYSEFLARLDRFYKAYRTQWYKVNKTYGFEVQDARLGGLMQRVKSCRERLLAYCDGAVSVIEELAEPVLPNDGGNVPFWKDMITANVI